ncbi:alpha/beta hydrolase family esterase [Actinomycetospora chiangmaiensis]|uniref:alpha/beta hydrolase family esterase n=1 Tax=Actinomycetospora chiangmaiensis TaxID=402650 RepID=UPI00035E6A61|nr:PHB depolymerase family esterase [Actinomycetospora chiangmaiensis]
MSSTRELQRVHPTAWLVVVVIAVLAAGCAASPAAPASSATTEHIVVGGVSRTYLLHRPAHAPAGAALPLVVMIHGGGGSAAGAERAYGWDGISDRDGVVVAYPEGRQGSWSVGGGCCGAAGRVGSDDVAFLTAMVSRIEQQLRIDPRRIYATGISEGGMMSYRLACETSLLAAVGPDSATLLGPCPDPHPLSVTHLHGTADTRIPYDGTPGSGINHITGPPIPTLIGDWRTVDRCPPPITTTHGIVTTTVATCPGGRAVELTTIAGAGHQWPGAACNARCGRGAADPPSTALDATTTIWDFFAAHPMAT